MNTLILMILIALLTCVVEIWDAVTKVCFKQSNWYGLLSYITKHFFTHLKNCTKRNDSFESSLSNALSLEVVIDKMVNYVFMIELIVFSYNTFLSI